VAATPLIGRMDELAVLHRSVAATARGNGGVLLVVGESGVGKSRLLVELAAQARRAGLQVVCGRAAAAAGAYRPVAEALLHAVGDMDPDVVPGLRPFRSALGRLVPGWAGEGVEPEPGLDPALVLGEGVVRLLRAVTADAGCLIVLEDLQWVDADTIALLELLAVRLRSLPVLIAGAARDDEVGSSAALRLARAPAVVTLRVEGLPRRELAALIGARAGQLAPEVVDALADRAGGLPVVAEELADAWATGTSTSVVAAVSATFPRALAQIVDRRLGSLSPLQQRILAVTAVGGADPDWALLPEVAGESQYAVLATARHAARAHLLEEGPSGLQWRPKLAGDVVRARLLPPERAAVALQWAEALLRRARPEDAVRAAELLAEGGESRRAAALFLELARRDRLAGALRRAQQLLGRAEEVGAPAAPVALERVALLTATGRIGAALETGASALSSATGEEHAQLCLSLARAAVRAARWGDARAYVERAGRPEDARALVVAADVAYGLGEVSDAADLAAAAVSSAERAGLPAVLCEALDIVARVHRLDDPAAAKSAFSRAAQIGAEHRLVPQRVASLVGLGTLELLESEDSTSLPQARDLALEAGLVGQASGAEVMLLEHLGLDQGPRAVEALAQELLDRGAMLHLVEVFGAGALWVALARAAAGDLSGMEAALADLRAAEGLREAVTLAPAVRALPALLVHDLDRANALLDAGVAPLVEHPVAAPLHHFGLWVLLRTVVDDRGDVAREALRSVPASHRPANRGALAYADAVAAGRAGRGLDAVTLLAAGDRDLGRLPWLHRLLRLLVLEAAVRDGWGDPVPLLRSDLAEHERVGEHQLARTCRDVLRRAGAPTRRGRGSTPVPPALRAAGVTGREMDVLTMVNAGLTNAQIAARLYLSPRTVETHVARLLTKLAVRDRTELRARAEALASPR